MPTMMSGWLAPTENKMCIFISTISYQWIPFNAARWALKKKCRTPHGSDFDQWTLELKPLLE